LLDCVFDEELLSSNTVGIAVGVEAMEVQALKVSATSASAVK
jgi:hypothetical protein